MKLKAYYIEKALMRVPPEARANVITKPGPVQDALAAHQKFAGYVFRKRGSRKIDENLASNTFKELKKQFQVASEEDNSSANPEEQSEENKNLLRK